MGTSAINSPLSPLSLCANLLKIKLPATKYLHTQEGKDKDEQDEQDQQSVDRGDGVHQRLHEVTHRRPVPKQK